MFEHEILVHRTAEECEQGPVHALVSAYACSPHWGSEIGIGWNWIINMAEYCQLTVITESEFQPHVSAALRANPPAFMPNFHFIDIGLKARKQCWNQGDWRFYSAYNTWQQRAFDLAARLSQCESFDVCHQLNMIGYREPGYLWKLPLPFVWGPIGGHVQMPLSYLSTLGVRGALFHLCRNTLNGIQMWCSPRVRKAASSANVLIAATEVDRRTLERIHGKKALLIPDTGTIANFDPHPRKFSQSLRVVWCGKFSSRKALPIALHALRLLRQENTPVELHIIGSGGLENSWKRLADEIGVSAACTWYGQIEHERALDIIAASDVMAVTSLQEAASTVVMEALANGLPVICHDSCGMGTVINSECGIKVPLINPSKSIEGFARAMTALSSDSTRLAELSAGALRRRAELTWRRKAEFMVALYKALSRRSSAARNAFAIT